MKQPAILFSLIFSGLVSQAQFNSADTLTPKAGEKQFTFAISNNSGFFAFKKYVSPKVAYRFGFWGNYNVSKSDNPSSQIYKANSGNDTIVHNINKSSNSEFALYFDFGFQRCFGSYRNFEPYLGLDIAIGNRFSKRVYENSNNYLNQKMINKTIIVNNFAPTVSLIPLVGFNYYLSEQFALGAEYRLSLINFNYSSGTKSTTTYEYSDGSSKSLEQPKSGKYTNLSGTFTGSAYITATLFIGKSSK